MVFTHVLTHYLLDLREEEVDKITITPMLPQALWRIVPPIEMPQCANALCEARDEVSYKSYFATV